jgi:hypothetical protein
VVSLYTSYVLGLRPSALFNDILTYLSKKKNIEETQKFLFETSIQVSYQDCLIRRGGKTGWQVNPNTTWLIHHPISLNPDTTYLDKRVEISNTDMTQQITG